MTETETKPKVVRLNLGSPNTEFPMILSETEARTYLAVCFKKPDAVLRRIWRGETVKTMYATYMSHEAYKKQKR